MSSMGMQDAASGQTIRDLRRRLAEAGESIRKLEAEHDEVRKHRNSLAEELHKQVEVSEYLRRQSATQDANATALRRYIRELETAAEGVQAEARKLRAQGAPPFSKDNLARFGRHVLKILEDAE